MTKKPSHKPAAANILDGLRMEGLLQRFGIARTSATSLRSDTVEVADLLADEAFAAAIDDLACSLGRDVADVTSEAAGYLREMAAIHSPRVDKAWDGLGRWLTRAHDVEVNEEQARRVRALGRKHSLLFLMSHKSYLDGFVLPIALATNDIAAPFTMGGANLNFFPFGAIASRTGVVFIRRSTSDNPIYRLALRSYIGQLIRNRQSLCWSIEGGRTRTGKLRPPAYGILRYVVDAVAASERADPLIIPVSFVYEQLHEVALMTTEARGGAKRPEDLRWLVNFALSQGERLGRAYLDFGDPLPVRERLAELSVDDPDGAHVVERIALETCHRINRATPVTATGVVCVALLAADRSLTLDEVLGTVAPLARYIQRRGRPVAGGVNLTDRATIQRTLKELVSSGVLASYSAGTEAVWGVAEHQHLVAAFYRNTVVHILADRAIGELALVAAAEADGDAPTIAEQESLRMRDLLKFDFFFPGRVEFSDEMRAELAEIDPTAADLYDRFTTDDAHRWLAAMRPYTAHLVLRPFVDAYHLVADRLAEWAVDEEFDEKRFLDECLRVGVQWVLQRRLDSEESVSLELFKPALRLARHRGLLDPTEPELRKLRRDFVDEILTMKRRIGEIAALARLATE